MDGQIYMIIIRVNDFIVYTTNNKILFNLINVFVKKIVSIIFNIFPIFLEYKHARVVEFLSEHLQNPKQS